VVLSRDWVGNLRGMMATAGGFRLVESVQRKFWREVDPIPLRLARYSMIQRVIAVRETATVRANSSCCTNFLHFPSSTVSRTLPAVVDINLFNEEVFGIPKSESDDELFQAIGFHI
jgi:hypothetical protein